MSSNTLSGPGRPRDQQLTERVLTAALNLMLEAGYQNVTLEAVARRAEVSRPAIYTRWPALADLLFDATLQARRSAAPYSGGDEVAIPDTGSLAGDLTQLVRHGMETMVALEQAGVISGIMSDVIRHPHLTERFRDEILQPDEFRYRQIFDRAVERGEIDSAPEPADVVPQLLLAYDILHRLILHDPKGTDDFDQVIALLLRGLGADPGSRS